MSQRHSRIQDRRLTFTALLLTIFCAGIAFPAGATPSRHTLDIDNPFGGCGGQGAFFLGSDFTGPCVLLLWEAQIFDPVDDAQAYKPRFQTARLPVDIDFGKPPRDRYRVRWESVPID